MATEDEPKVSSNERTEARRKAVVRVLKYRGPDLSSEKVAEILEEGRPELGITKKSVTYFRRRNTGEIHAPKK